MKEERIAAHFEVNVDVIRSQHMIGTHQVVDRAARNAGRIPEIERIAPGVWAVAISCAPLPVSYTFAYIVVGDGDSFIVIDPGAESPEGRQQLLDGIDAAGVQFENLIGIVATHEHWDHMGAAERLPDATNAWLGIHPLEAWPVVGTPDSEQRFVAYSQWLTASGAPADVVQELSARQRRRSRHFTEQRVTRELEDGAYLPLPGRKLRVVWTPGHTAGHICIADEDHEILFTGDHVLPTIHPNIGAFADRPDADTLGGYLASLEKLAPWGEYQICPGHEYHFRGLAERSAQLRARLAGRLEEVAAARAAQPDATLWEITAGLRWRRGWDALENTDREDALAATRAHLNHIDHTDPTKSAN